jgi:Lon protease-like protein
MNINRLPLFPLNTVLFPGQLLPLHIFEPRYRLMIKECLAGQSAFGVILIREGREVGDSAVPFDVGCTARIEQVNRLEDGRLNLLCVGQSRFKVTQLRHDRPFLSADVELWPWAPVESGDAGPQVEKVKRLLTVYLERLAKVTGSAIHLDEMPTAPAPLANLAAIVLQIPNAEKQALLAAPSIELLFENCIDLLTRENRALKIAAALPLPPSDDSLPFSSN